MSRRRPDYRHQDFKPSGSVARISRTAPVSSLEFRFVRLRLVTDTDEEQIIEADIKVETSTMQ